MPEVDIPTIGCVTNIFHDIMWSSVLLMLLFSVLYLTLKCERTWKQTSCDFT